MEHPTKPDSAEEVATQISKPYINSYCHKPHKNAVKLSSIATYHHAISSKRKLKCTPQNGCDCLKLVGVVDINGCGHKSALHVHCPAPPT